MRIQHNIAALNSHRQLTNNNNSVSKSLEKLSSGFRINRAGDDAAGLAISEKMRAQITGLETAQKNANDGISLIQTAEGALTEVHSMLNRMVELANQSANGVYDDETDRANLQKEMDSLTKEINRISDGTNFNGLKLLDGSLDATSVSGSVTFGANEIAVSGGPEGTEVTISAQKATAKDTITVDFTTAGKVTITLGSADASTYTAEDINKAIKDALEASADEDLKKDFANFKVSTDDIDVALDDATTGNVTTAVASDKALSLQIGDTAEAFNQLEVSVGNMSSEALGLSTLDISTQQGAKDAVDVIKAAINTVSSTRGDLGALQNRLEHTINNLSVTTENMTAAESRIRDVDMAKEMMSYTKNNILVQASQAMLAQANQLPQGVLQLLQ